MPGAYAHLTLINLAREPKRLREVNGFPAVGIAAAQSYLKYCELGAVSPDYPYMALGNSRAASWADAMHYERTGEMIHSGIRLVGAMNGEKQKKCLAWLFGYASHVVADLTIHPVVLRKVGPYAENQLAHRVCEMHQDAYVFRRLGVGAIGLAEHLKSGIGACGDGKGLDLDIAELWKSMLREIHPREYASNAPDPSLWHRRFRLVVDEIAEGATHLVPLARHVATGLGLTYPAPEAIDMGYIENLALPDGRKGTYDAAFDHAVTQAVHVLDVVARGCLAGDGGYRTELANYDLDTGSDTSGRLAYWARAQGVA